MSYMIDTFFTLLAIAGLLIVLPVLPLWARHRIRTLIRRHTPELRDAHREARRQRMLHPNVEEVEALCGGLLPQKLIDLYTDSHLLPGSAATNLTLDGRHCGSNRETQLLQTITLS